MLKLTDEVRETVLRGLAEGKSLRTACAELGISHWMWNRALSAEPELAHQYAHAKEVGLDAMAEEILEISDDGTNDWMERTGKAGEVVGYQVNGEHVQRSKLRVDSRKWLLSKMAPKKYGDKVQQEISGGDKPVSITFKWKGQ